jgi:hypothetical protein
MNLYGFSHTISTTNGWYFLLTFANTIKQVKQTAGTMRKNAGANVKGKEKGEGKGKGKGKGKVLIQSTLRPVKNGA